MQQQQVTRIGRTIAQRIKTTEKVVTAPANSGGIVGVAVIVPKRKAVVVAKDIWGSVRFARIEKQWNTKPNQRENGRSTSKRKPVLKAAIYNGEYRPVA
jgi:hypothetical protein